MQVFRFDLQATMATLGGPETPFSYTFHYALTDPAAPVKDAAWASLNFNWGNFFRWPSIFPDTFFAGGCHVQIVNGAGQGDYVQTTSPTFRGLVGVGGLPWECCAMISRWCSADPPKQRGRLYLSPLISALVNNLDGWEQNVQTTNFFLLSIISDMKQSIGSGVTKLEPVIFHRDTRTASVIDRTSVYNRVVMQRRRRPQRLR